MNSPSVSGAKQYRTGFQDGGKISSSVGLKKEKDKFSRQCKAFMDGLDRLIVSSPLIAVGFFIPKGFVIHLTCHLFAIAVKGKYQKCSVVLLFRHNFKLIFLGKALKSYKL